LIGAGVRQRVEAASAREGAKRAPAGIAEPVDKTFMARAFALLFGGGGTLVLVTLLLPHSSDRSLAGMIVPSVLAYGVAAIAVAGGGRLPLRVFQALPAFGAVLVTAVAYSSGTGEFNAYALIYFWVVVSAFYFFAWREGAISLFFIAAGYGAVLLHHDAAENRLLYWIMGVGTIVGGSILIAFLRGRIAQLLRALHESDSLKTTIIRSVSHDFRTPLTAIIAAGESSASTTLDADSRREIASVIVTEASRLSQTLAKLLDMSRLEAGAAVPHSTLCSVEEVIEAALDHTPGADRFEIAGDSTLPVVWADAAQLESAFFNLFENSIRFGGGGTVQVALAVDEGNVVVRISDDGPGLDPAERERVFEPFYRGPGEPSGHYGPGLGLAIAKGFVETNGGRVWVEPHPEAGSTFIVELPIPAESQR
jgi:signal transduction histidine kinase